MPSADTFSIPPIRELVKWRLKDCAVIVDPFARNSRFGTLTNDLNPETAATHHMDAIEFLTGLVAEGVQADAVLFDPPYSNGQIIEMYQKIGRAFTGDDDLNRLGKHKDLMDRVLKTGGIAICCGWNSMGMGVERRYSLEEILLVPHGRVHNDTIVTVERKMQAGFGFGAQP